MLLLMAAVMTLTEQSFACPCLLCPRNIAMPLDQISTCRASSHLMTVDCS